MTSWLTVLLVVIYGLRMRYTTMKQAGLLAWRNICCETMLLWRSTQELTAALAMLRNQLRGWYRQSLLDEAAQVTQFDALFTTYSPVNVTSSQLSGSLYYSAAFFGENPPTFSDCPSTTRTPLTG